MNVSKKSYGTGTGGITVFMVLAVLISAVFAVLTMSSAMMDMRLSEKSAEMSRFYYSLDTIGTKMLAEVEQSWLSGITDGGQISEKLYQLAPEAEIAVGTDTYSGICYVSITIPAGDARLFVIEAYMQAAGGSPVWTVDKWSLGSASFGEEEIDTGTPVYIIQ